jgi:hypothetical protein
MSKPISRFNFNMPTEIKAYIVSIAGANEMTETDVILMSVRLMRTLGQLGISTHFVISPQNSDAYPKDIVMPFNPSLGLSSIEE